ncbi:MAG: 3D domain-containing protein [Verrucomicrobia bacterium]|nr:3D domain-containing protein [Verrucomicrobiota bacterium]
MRLSSGLETSASADWSWFPVGTKFRLADSNRIYVIDDYGSALLGSKRIDLFMPSKRAAENWGRRRVKIEVLQMGSFEISRRVLKSRTRDRLARRMLFKIEEHLQNL